MVPEKQTILDDLRQNLNDSPYLLVADYGGMKVDQLSELRNRLAEVDAEFHVVKNTLLAKSLEAEEFPELNGHLAGQTAVCYGKADVSSAAKVLKNFASEFEKPNVRAGIVDRAVIDADQVKAIADLPSREVLLAKILGLLNTPAGQLARIINTPAGQLAQVLKAKAEKGE
ncbi:MAG: 50S ribosomal protein L10 [Verrucomicrobiota bacterium]